MERVLLHHLATVVRLSSSPSASRLVCVCACACFCVFSWVILMNISEFCLVLPHSTVVSHSSVDAGGFTFQMDT